MSRPPRNDGWWFPAGTGPEKTANSHPLAPTQTHRRDDNQRDRDRAVVRLDVIRAQRELGLTLAAIAKCHRVSGTRVSQILAGDTPRRGNPPEDASLSYVDVHVLVPHRSALSDLFPVAS